MSRRLLGFVLLAFLASQSRSALAQGESNIPPFPENGVTFFVTNGNYARKKLSAPEMDMLMSAGAKPLPVGTLLTMHDGKFYVVDDHKMHDGKMLSDELGLRGAAGR